MAFHFMVDAITHRLELDGAMLDKVFPRFRARYRVGPSLLGRPCSSWLPLFVLKWTGAQLSAMSWVPLLEHL